MILQKEAFNIIDLETLATIIVVCLIIIDHLLTEVDHVAEDIPGLEATVSGTPEDTQGAILEEGDVQGAIQEERGVTQEIEGGQGHTQEIEEEIQGLP